MGTTDPFFPVNVHTGFLYLGKCDTHISTQVKLFFKGNNISFNGFLKRGTDGTSISKQAAKHVHVSVWGSNWLHR